MNEWDRSLYVLAEILHMPVYQIRAEMPMSEFLGWIEYLKNKHVKEEPVIDVTQMSKDDLQRMFNK